MRVVLTGAAGGIGRSVAARLVDANHDVVGLDRDHEGLAELPDEVDVHALDLADQQSVEDTLGDIDADAFVSCVGWYELGALEECSPDTLREHLESNLLAVHSPIQTLLSTLRRRQGRIVVVGSMTGSVPLPYHGAYSTAKAGVSGYVNALRREISPRGVDVSLIEPGPVRTGFNERAAKSLARSTDSAYRDEYRPFREYSPESTTPDAVAQKIETVLGEDSPRARYRVGRRARWLPRLGAVLPTGLYDRILRSGLPGGLLHRLVDR